jgi:hypothetical protein
VQSWLQSVPTTRTAFNLLYGNCPYCSTAITVPVPIGE